MWQHVSELMHLVSYRFTNQFTCCTICEFHTVTEYCSGALVRILKSGIATEHTLELLSMCAQHECRDLRRRYNYIPASEAVRASAQLLGVCPLLRIVGLYGEGATPYKTSLLGECRPNRHRTRCCAFGCVCGDPIVWGMYGHVCR